MNSSQFLLKSSQTVIQSVNYIASMIDSANLAEGGRLFLNGLMSAAKKKNFGRLLESHISGTAGPIPFKINT